MIFNRSELNKSLSQLDYGYLVQYSSWYADGPMEVVVTGLSGVQVFLNLMIIIILTLYCINNKEKNNNSFYYIVNLAATDIVGFLLIFISLKFQDYAWAGKTLVYDEFQQRMAESCHNQMGLLSFSWLNTILATVFLTFDRFLFISRPFDYKIIATKESCLMKF